MKWQDMTAIYVIGNSTPSAVFASEQAAELWAEEQFPGEWIKKVVKIPCLPFASKKAKKDLKQLASVLESMDWSDGDDDDDGDPTPTKTILATDPE